MNRIIEKYFRTISFRLLATAEHEDKEWLKRELAQMIEEVKEELVK